MGATVSQESRHAGLSPPGDQTNVDSFIGVSSSENRTATDSPVRLPVGRDWSGDPAGLAPDGCMATTGTDTMSAGSSVNWMEGNTATADQPVNSTQ